MTTTNTTKKAATTTPRKSKGPMRELVVDRRYWGRGEAGGGSLNDGAGQMCILGIYLHRLVKIPKSKLLDLSDPQGVLENYSRPRPYLNKIASAGACWLLNVPDETERRNDPDEFSCSDAAEAIYKINDNTYLSDSEREKQIKRHFAKFNVRVIFTH